MKSYLSAFVLFCCVSHAALAADVWTNLFAENLSDARDGDIDAQYEVGIMYLKGQGVKPDRRKAIEWLKTAAENGNDQAGSKLARIEKNRQSFEKMRKQADGGDSRAQYETGMMLLSGKGTDIDPDSALRWLEEAARQGHKKAITRLGILYFKGDAVAGNPQRAVELLQRVASDQALAQYYLGEAYATGKGVDRDYATALNWYRQAEQSGYRRATGKVINMEEEIRMLERRKARVAREKAEQEKLAREASAQQQEASQQARLAAEKAVRVATRKTADRKARAASKTARAARPAFGLRYLLERNWESKGKSINFLPSSLNQCESEPDRLVCYSHDIRESSVGRDIKYRVKSIITRGSGKDSFHVMYRNLVLEANLQDSEATERGYDDGREQGYQVKTGWSKKHEADCSFDSASQISCLKDGLYKISIVAGQGGADSHRFARTGR